jgi:hypothetical protein
MTSEQAQPEAALASGIADALAGLQDLDERPTAEHAERFRAVHEALVAALSSIDEV